MPMADNKVHEVFRYARGHELRIYSFHVVPGGTELWRVTQRASEPDESVMETSFTRPVEAAQFLEEVTRTLIAGGWRRQ
jgi:hypothetical protein